MAKATPPPDLASEEGLAKLGANWSCDSNDAATVKLWRVSEKDDALHCEHTFHPSYTYPMFGDEETLFGYQNLHVDFNFAAHDLRLNVDVRYTKKFAPVGDIEAVDIPKALESFVPAGAFGLRKDFASALEVDQSAATFTPPGRVIHNYSVSGQHYEVWCSNLLDPRAQEIMRNSQVLMPMFIEGATVINLDDADENVYRRWKIYLVYRLVPPKPDAPPSPTISKYSLVGYATSYRLWYLSAGRAPKPAFPPDYVFPAENLSSSITATLPSLPTPVNSASPTPISSPADDPFPDTMADVDHPVRERISQFLILPPFRGAAHGTHLYTAMTALFLSDPRCLEITVEDPNEAFDDLRDYLDYARLTNNAANPGLLADPALAQGFTALRIDPDKARDAIKAMPRDKQEGALPVHAMLDVPAWRALHRASKIHHREFDRVLEMRLLSQIPAAHRTPARLALRHNAPQAADRTYYFWRCLVRERLTLHNRDSLRGLEKEEREERLAEALGNVQLDYERLLEGIRRRLEKAEAIRAVAGEEDGGGVESRGQKRKLARVVVDDEEDEDDDGGVGIGSAQANGSTNGGKKARVEEE
ncbi:MAG: histone acetyltransferase 1 [Bathelium mastoideum]|nr:MAG: histone acetyltransferase 1 [Bathelium mastoideum]